MRLTPVKPEEKGIRKALLADLKDKVIGARKQITGRSVAKLRAAKSEPAPAEKKAEEPEEKEPEESEEAAGESEPTDTKAGAERLAAVLSAFGKK